MARAAEADDATSPSSEEDAPKIILTPQAPPQGNSRTYHRHEGFYLRANFGLGLHWSSFDDESSQDFDVDASGTGMGLDLLIGGSPTAGVAIGGGLISNWIFSAGFDANGERVDDRDVRDATVGVFIDGFPIETGPWHLGALVGLTGVQIGGDDYVQNTMGLGGAIWAGYDQWVGDELAVGGLLRLTVNHTTGEESNLNVGANTATLGFMFTALYH